MESSSDETSSEIREPFLGRFFNPFPPASTTLIVGPSMTGKSYFLKQVLEHQHLFFDSPVERVVVVNCRDNIRFYDLEQKGAKRTRQVPKVEQFAWEVFQLTDLREGDVVIIDDLQVVTDLLRELITTSVHHSNLAHLFVVTHSVLRTPKYEILSYAHRVLVFMSGASGTNLVSYIVRNLFRDEELKEYLTKILGSAQKQKTTLSLQINNLPGSLEPYHIALSHLEELFNKNFAFAVVYSHPANIESYRDQAVQFRARKFEPAALAEAKKTMPKASALFPGSFLVVDPDSVEDIRNMAAEPLDDELFGSAEGDYHLRDGVDSDGCLRKGKELWNQTVLNLESDIENFVPSKKWLKAKNLLSEILRNPDICILDDQRRMRLKADKDAVVSLLDFVLAVSRREGPSEKKSRGSSREYKLYRLFVASLLERQAPQMLFVNKLLIPSSRSSTTSHSQSRHSSGSSKNKRKETRKSTRRRSSCSRDYPCSRHRREKNKREKQKREAARGHRDDDDDINWKREDRTPVSGGRSGGGGGGGPDVSDLFVDG